MRLTYILSSCGCVRAWLQAKRQVVQTSAALSMGREVVQSLVGAEALLCVLQVAREPLRPQ